MSLLPHRRRFDAVHPATVSAGFTPDPDGYQPPLRLLPRIALLLVLIVIFHGFALFAVSQVVRSRPELMTANPAVGTLLCGDGATLRLDFRPPGSGRPRGLANWIECIDAAGVVDRDAGTLAAGLSGLVLTVPFALIMVGVILRMNGGPGGRGSVMIRTPSEPARWTDRLIFSVMVLVIAAVVTGATGAYVTQYHSHLVEHPTASRLACGERLTPAIVFPYSRGRRLGCFNQDGTEDEVASRYAMLRLLAPFYVLLILPGIWLVFRIRSVQRLRSIPLRD
ncbi:MAG: hypothetical protein Q8S29_20820 [Phreatobacter sp.]|nr:hypothetical protein [Phreatobacter sp.]